VAGTSNAGYTVQAVGVTQSGLPIEPRDIAAFPEIFSRAILEVGDPPLIGNTPMVAGKAVYDGFHYAFAAKVSYHLVTLYKWRL